jgi:branched-chain amino acid transport system ATP-binding protein
MPRHREPTDHAQDRQSARLLRQKPRAAWRHFEVQPGEIVALLGRNGSGRSTTAKAIMGMVDCQGSLHWKGQEIMGRKPYEIAHLGIGYVPENRDIFPNPDRAPEPAAGPEGRRQGQPLDV